MAESHRKKAMTDPTYIKTEIDANPVWKLAFWMSEIDNDNAPLGWGRYRVLAQALLAEFELTSKADTRRLNDDLGALLRGERRR
jgi:hypothetical protein